MTLFDQASIEKDIAASLDALPADHRAAVVIAGDLKTKRCVAEFYGRSANGEWEGKFRAEHSAEGWGGGVEVIRSW